MTTLKLNATFACVFAHLCSHLIVAIIVRRRRRVVRSRIPEPEAEVCYRVVAFRILQTVDRVLQTVLCDAVVETAATHHACGNANDFLECAGGVHDSKCACETVKEKCCSGFVLHRFDRLGEFGRDMRQHVISWVLWRRREYAPHDGCGKCAAWEMALASC